MITNAEIESLLMHYEQAVDVLVDIMELELPEKVVDYDTYVNHKRVIAEFYDKVIKEKAAEES